VGSLKASLTKRRSERGEIRALRTLRLSVILFLPRPRRLQSPNGIHHVFGAGKRGKALLGDDVVIDEHGQLTMIAIDHFDLDAQFASQSCRQTGGMLAGFVSDRALANG